jgi:hypothetical protein
MVTDRDAQEDHEGAGEKGEGPAGAMRGHPGLVAPHRAWESNPYEVITWKTPRAPEQRDDTQDQSR